MRCCDYGNIKLQKHSTNGKQTLSPAKQSLSPELRFTHRSLGEGGTVALPADLASQKLREGEENLRRLVLLLIKEDLRSSKLVLGLSALGLDAGKYHTELSTVIFSLLGLDCHADADRHDHLQGIYFECIDKASEIEDVEDVKRMEGMAEEVLEQLVKTKEII